VTALGFAGSDLIHVGFAYMAAWFAGERTRLRREQMTELRQRAVLAERQAARERQLAVAEERARIARDLHASNSDSARWHSRSPSPIPCEPISGLRPAAGTA
jgi:hypothetical protein